MPKFSFSIFSDFIRVYTILPQKLQRSCLHVLCCILAQAVVEVIGILAISALAISIAAPERLTSHVVVRKVVDILPWLQGLMADAQQFAVLVAAAAACLIGIKNGMAALVNFFSGRLGEHIALFAGNTIFHTFLYSPYTQHMTEDSQNMFQAMSWRGELGRMIVQILLFYSYIGISLALCLLLIAFTPGIVLVIMLLIGVAAFCIYSKLKGCIDTAGKDSAEWRRAENATCMNAMRGIREILIYGQQNIFFQHYQNACHRVLQDRAFLTMAPAVPTWILETMGFVGLAGTIWIMTVFLDASMAKITAVVTTIMLVCWRILPLLNRSLGSLVSIRGMRHAAFSCLVKVEEALQNPPPPAVEPDPNFTIERELALDAISFTYPGAETPCLHAVSISIPHGSRLGIVGRSGAGKSSLANILCGLVQPDSGTMLIDGKSLTAEGREAYCRQVGYVPQNPYILSGSIAENVAFSQWGLAWDEKRVRSACSMAELDIAFSRGLDCKLGQGGLGLSGGQAQRLSIARALYANPSVLILDEATSALDSAVEAAIMKTIFSLPRNITTIIIAHRLSTVKNCDHVVWIDQGNVKAAGKADAVIAEYEVFLKNSQQHDAVL